MTTNIKSAIVRLDPPLFLLILISNSYFLFLYIFIIKSFFILQLGYVVRTYHINFEQNQSNDMTTIIKSAIFRPWGGAAAAFVTLLIHI